MYIYNFSQQYQRSSILVIAQVSCAREKHIMASCILRCIANGATVSVEIYSKRKAFDDMTKVFFLIKNSSKELESI